MADARISKALLAMAWWHVWSAARILHWLVRSLGDTRSEKAAEKTGLVTNECQPPISVVPEAGPAAASQPFGSSPSLAAPLICKGDFLTNDIVEIRGRLGSDDRRDLTINGQIPLRLEFREHVILLVLGWLSKCAALPPKPGRSPLPTSAPAKVIVEVLDVLTAEKGPLAGYWNYPSDLDIFRSVSKLRRRLRKRGFNPNLIQSGPRNVGYRLSTPASQIIVRVVDEPWAGFWAQLFDALFGGRGGSGEASSRSR